ncbi:hypothetical protein J2R98_002950 [Alkalibacillus filiformis]|uniref:Uncharacterized protein n=1 Tax=Alkalibacillus filiformis TaxID=200990 RepID=A0ABU0DX98_9BACI|nr:hypothetical protein [Alkalibacillus filiformis]
MAWIQKVDMTPYEKTEQSRKMGYQPIPCQT